MRYALALLTILSTAAPGMVRAQAGPNIPGTVIPLFPLQDTNGRTATPAVQALPGLPTRAVVATEGSFADIPLPPTHQGAFVLSIRLMDELSLDSMLSFVSVGDERSMGMIHAYENTAGVGTAYRFIIPSWAVDRTPGLVRVKMVTATRRSSRNKVPQVHPVRAELTVE